ncbi:hypothetical protein [Streptomyces sp. KLOTTS4A1]|uniref:hypothetical protein n=1 Tax=Streptomyces sp. KLOTTS4A1 TaxID=3390996 RepID=UPI0039F59977
MHFDDNEPVFKRSKWGTSRYEYNPRNPVGLVLIIISAVVAGVMMLLMANHAGPFAHPPRPTPSSPAPTEDFSRFWPQTDTAEEMPAPTSATP